MICEYFLLHITIEREANMNTKTKWQLQKQRFMKLKWLILKFIGKGSSKKLKQYLALMGDNNLFQPSILPSDPSLIKIHDNVKIASAVTFYNHDVINSVFSGIDKIPYQTHGECIEIFDNVFIGGHSIILGGVRIGPNAIVAAGSVVTKNVDPGTIVGGNPAKVIGSFEELHNRRRIEDGNKNELIPNNRANELWERFYER